MHKMWTGSAHWSRAATSAASLAQSSLANAANAASCARKSAAMVTSTTLPVPQEVQSWFSRLRTAALGNGTHVATGWPPQSPSMCTSVAHLHATDSGNVTVTPSLHSTSMAAW
jgi:hypothetical protein